MTDLAASPRPPVAPSAPRPLPPGAPRVTAPHAPVTAPQPAPRAPTAAAPAAPVAARVPEPGPPPATTSGGIARSVHATRNAFMADVDVLQPPFTAGTLAGDAHLNWLRGQYAQGADVKGALERLADRVATGTNVVLVGPPDVTRNIDAALRYTLQARHGLTGKTLWTHTAPDLAALDWTWHATLILGGRPATTYTFAFAGDAVTVDTTQGPRHYSRATLQDTLYGAYFTDVHPVTPPSAAGPAHPARAAAPVVVLTPPPTALPPAPRAAWEHPSEGS